MTIIIGLHGAKGSGKDQFFKSAKQQFPKLDIRKIAYADPIKNEVCRIFNLNNEDEYDYFKRVHISYKVPGVESPIQVAGRQIVREIGMMMRRYDVDQFVDYVEHEIRKAPDAVWCITDLRFDNEWRSVRRMDGVVVKINRDGIDYDGHVTETELPDSDCDYILENVNLTLQGYGDVVSQTMRSILKKVNV